MEIDLVQWVILLWYRGRGLGRCGHRRWRIDPDPDAAGGPAGLAPAAALGTSKLAAVTGTGSAAVTLARKVKLDKAEMARFLLIALVCSGLGASVASSLDKDIMRPIIIVLMVAVGVFVAFKPDFGSSDAAGTRGGWRTVVVLVLSGIISFYDGIFGPGTGMF